MRRIVIPSESVSRWSNRGIWNTADSSAPQSTAEFILSLSNGLGMTNMLHIYNKKPLAGLFVICRFPFDFAQGFLR